MKRWSIFSLLLVVVMAVTACAAPAAPAPAPTEPPTAVPTEAAPKDIVDTAVAAGSFTTLVAAVQAAGLVDTLKSEGPFTVFAPTDEAFAALPKETLDGLLADPEALAKILTYHVLAGKVMAADVTDGLSADTVAGPAVAFKIVDGKPMINDANIIATDVTASNGVIHVIDKVILPPAEEAAAPSEAEAKDIVDTAVAAGSFTTLVAAVQAAGLVDTLKGEGPFTVFAPTDEAFAALPKETLDGLLAYPEALGKILTYHVLAGKVMAANVSDGLSAETVAGPAVAFKIINGKPMINDANIIATDVEASNGVIHVIDKVILPPAEEAAAPSNAEAKDIVDTAVAAGSFTTLVTAVQAAGLVDTLKSEGPFTVFAPTDEAFAALPKETLNRLLADPKALAEILTYHVLAGKVMAADVSDGLSAATVAGPNVTFKIMNGKPMINDANIIATDIEASNGVIHVIDKVVLPKSK
jgi:uncharacterized surface protein with fasciclin (FAS1) repeats